MNWYICKGRGRLVVVRGEPNIEDYVLGPFATHDDAFERMQELELKRESRDGAMRTGLTLVAVILMGAFAGMAMAEGNGNDGSDRVSATSFAAAGAFAGARATVGDTSAEGGSAVASGGDSNATGGNAEGGQGVGDVSFNETKQFRNAPWVNPPAIQSSNPCATGWSAGVSGPGIGIGGGRVKEDEQCNLRETARLAYSFGAGAAALELLCTSEAWVASGVPCPTGSDLTSDSTDYIDDRLAAGLVQIREDLVTERDAVCAEKVARCEAEVRK